MITTDTILNAMKSWVANKQIQSPSTWLDGALKLNVLIGEEHDKLFELESKVAQRKLEVLEAQNCPVARANLIIEAEPIYKEYRRQKARIDQINEFIKIAKKQATLKSEEMKGY